MWSWKSLAAEPTTDFLTDWSNIDRFSNFRGDSPQKHSDFVPRLLIQAGIRARFHRIRSTRSRRIVARYTSGVNCQLFTSIT